MILPESADAALATTGTILRPAGRRRFALVRGEIARLANGARGAGAAVVAAGLVRFAAQAPRRLGPAAAVAARRRVARVDVARAGLSLRVAEVEALGQAVFALGAGAAARGECVAGLASSGEIAAAAGTVEGVASAGVDVRVTIARDVAHGVSCRVTVEARVGARVGSRIDETTVAELVAVEGCAPAGHDRQAEIEGHEQGAKGHAAEGRRRPCGSGRQARRHDPKGYLLFPGIPKSLGALADGHPGPSRPPRATSPPPPARSPARARPAPGPPRSAASLGRLARPPSQTVGPLVLLAAANLKIAVGCSALGV